MNKVKQWLAEYFDKKLIPDWRAAWDKLSIRWNALLIAAGTFWILLPSDVQTQIIDTVLGFFGVPTSWTIVVIGVVGVFLRLKKQEPKD
jgi:hypothetical protein